MKTIRIFISSPGDVEEERERAVQTVQQLRRRYAGRLTLETVRWEDLPLQADTSFQKGIDVVLSNTGIDIAIFILWSRLGSPQGGNALRPDGTPYRSGTERELDLMLEARHQSGGTHPDMLVYTRSDEVSFEERLRGKSTAEKEQEITQKRLVESFITEEFQDATQGVNRRAFHSFDRPTTFSERLRHHLQSLLDERAGDLPDDPVWDIHENGPPFLGLEAFQPRHAPVFFGREEEILEVRRALRRRTREGTAFVMIAGASGSGKSSLARAGVLPEILANETDETVSHWVPLIATPGQLGTDPLDAFAAKLAAVLPGLRDSTHLAADLAENPSITLRHAILPALDAHRLDGKKPPPGSLPRLLLLIDQLEEMLTTWPADLREKFAAILEALATSGRVWVLVTLRADFLGVVQQVPALVRLRADGGQVDLLPPQAPAIARLITDPARLAGLRFEEKNGVPLADRIVADATGHAELLPLTGHLLAELFEHRTAENVLTFDRYESVGGVAGALASHADAVFKKLDAQAQTTFGPVMRRIVTVSGEDENSFVRQYPPIQDFHGDERRMLDAFIAGRLVTTTAEGTVTLAHEALLRAWLPAKSWIEANAEFLRIRARIATRIKEGSPLLAGDPLLETTKAALATHPEGFDPAQRKWIEAAIADAATRHRRTTRRRRLAFTAISALALLATVTAAFALLASIHAHLQTTEALEANAKNEANLAAASNADFAAAVKALEEDFEARQNGKRAEGFAGKSRWHEAVALLARSLERNPRNTRALHRLMDTLALQGRARWDLPWFSRHYLVDDHVAVLSPNGTRFLTVDNDNTAQIWDTLTGEAVGKPMHHERWLSISQFSPDGGSIITVSMDAVQVWDATTGEAVGEPMHHVDNLRIAEFCTNSNRIITASSDAVQVWDVMSGEAIGEPMRHEHPVTKMASSPDGNRIVTVNNSGTCQIWDLATGDPIGKLMRHEGSVTSAVFSPDGSRILTANSREGGYKYTAQGLEKTSDETILFWDAATGEIIGQPILPQGKKTSALFSPDASCVLTFSQNGIAQLWDATTGEVIGVPMHHERNINSVVFSPDGRLILALSYEGTARFWEAATGKPVGEPMRLHVANARFSRDGSQIIATCRDRAIRIWDAPKGEAISMSIRQDGVVIASAFSSDGSRILTTTRTTARVWNADSREALGELMHQDKTVNHAAFSPEGTRILTSTWETLQNRTTVQVRDLSTGKAIGAPMHHESSVNRMVFSPDGNRIVTATMDGVARLWEAATGQAIGEPMNHEDVAVSVVFSSDGSRILTATRYTTQFWDAATGKAIGEPMHYEDWVRSAVLSQDGSRILTATTHGIAQIWDVVTRKTIGQPMRHEKSIKVAVFSPDGNRILTVGEGTARFWDAHTGEAIGEPMRHVYPVTSAVFSPSGNHILTDCLDKLRLWPISTINLLEMTETEHESLLRWAYAISGIYFDERGNMVDIPLEDRLFCIREDHGLPPQWRALSRWLQDRSPERTSSFFSTFTIREIAERDRDYGDAGTVASLTSAIDIDPTLPLTRILLARALEVKSREPDPALPAWAAFLRRYDLDLLAKQRSQIPDQELALLYARAAQSLNEAPGDAQVGIGPHATNIREEALKAAEQAIDLDHDLALGHREKARALSLLESTN